LACEDAVVADFGGAGQAGLAADHVVGAKLGGMAYQDQVVDFGAATYAGFAHRGSVDAGIGLDFDVVFEDCWAGLDDFVPGAVFFFGEAQPVAADDGAWLEDYAVAYAAVFADYGMGVGEEIVADFGALIDGYETVENCVLTYFYIFVDEAVGAYVGALGDSGGSCDYRRWVNARFVLGWLVEEFEGLGEGKIGIGGAEGGQVGEIWVAVQWRAFFNQDCGGSGGF
jgi:hypothetical protein